MQRALRDADRRLADLGHSQGALTTTVDGKLDTMARRIQRDGAKLRSETHGLLADLEELTLQMYEEHEAALRTVKSEADALRCENEAQLAQQHAQIQAQQSQIDVLTAQLQQQTALLSEFRTQSGAVMAAMTDELKELRRGFGTQAEALTATKAYVSAAEEKLAAQIEKRVRTSELMAAGTAEALTARVDDQQRLFSQTLETQRTQQASYDALLAWKTKTDEKAAAAADERAALAAEARGAKEAAAEAEASMRRELNEVAAPWPTLLGEMRDELAKMEGKKADAAELSERADGLGDRVGALERQVCEQLGPEVATVGATVAQIRASDALSVAASGSGDGRQPRSSGSESVIGSAKATCSCALPALLLPSASSSRVRWASSLGAPLPAIERLSTASRRRAWWASSPGEPLAAIVLASYTAV